MSLFHGLSLGNTLQPPMVGLVPPPPGLVVVVDVVVVVVVEVVVVDVVVVVVRGGLRGALAAPAAVVDTATSAVMSAIPITFRTGAVSAFPPRNFNDPRVGVAPAAAGTM